MELTLLSRSLAVDYLKLCRVCASLLLISLRVKMGNVSLELKTRKDIMNELV